MTQTDPHKRAAAIVRQSIVEVFPRVAHDVQRVVSRTAATARDLEAAVRQDGALAQAVMRQATATPGSRNGLGEAIVSIGPQAVRDLAMVFGFARSAENSGGRARRYWAHCVRTACITEAIARDQRVRRADAFAAGAMCDFGVIAMLHCGPPEYAALVDEVGISMIGLDTREWDAFGFDHAQLGDLILRTLEFPPAVSQAVLEHHGASSSALADMVAVAASVDVALSMGLTPRDAADDTLERVRPSRVRITPTDLARYAADGVQRAVAHRSQVGGF